MVQYTTAEGGGVVSEPLPAAVGDYLQPYLSSLEQIPHSQLTHPAVTTVQPTSSQYLDDSTTSQPLVPQFYTQDSTSSEVPQSVFQPYPDQFSGTTTTSSEFQPVSGDMSYVSGEQSFYHAPVSSSSFDAFGLIDNIPITRLDSSYVIPEVSLESANDDVSRAFTVVPVTQSEVYADLENTAQQQQQKDVYDGLDNAVDNSLQKPAYANSMDSLSDHKGYYSDSSSDVYMNSDYTDTVTSADSSAFLLRASTATINSSDDHDSTESSHQVPNSEEAAEAATTTYYRNEAFSDSSSSKELISWSSEESVEEKKQEKVEETESKSAGHGIEWIVTIPEEDSGAMADKEDDEDEVEEEKEQLMPLSQCNVELENLVQKLADQHPSEMVDIQVQVLDGPVYESLTEPLDESNWLQSTESLHHYKLLKQGRMSAANSLRLQAVANNLRANTMNNLHERNSFLNLTAASVSNLGRACQKALTYVRADMEFGSMMSLKDSMTGCKGGQPPSDLEALNSEFTKKGEPTVASGRHTKNVLYMALLVTILLISVNATRNLQSSLNQEGGVGITCLAIMFASYMLGSLLSPVLVQGVGVKGCITGGLVLQLLYVAANLYPVMWVMVPASLGGGASLALIWNAMSTYIVLLARGEATSKQKSYERVSDKYFGIFCLIYQSNLIVGNLIASLVLTFGDSGDSDATIAAGIFPLNGTSLNSTAAASQSAEAETNVLTPIQEVGADLLGMVMGGEMGGESNALPSAVNSTLFDATTESHYHLCGSAYCHSFVLNQDASAVSDRTIYLLFGIFMSLVVVTILMAIFLLEPLSPKLLASTSAPWHNVKRQFVSLVKFSRNVKFLLLLPLMLYSVMQFSFVCSEVMMAYVTCPLGVWLVGYTMMAYGVCCSIASYATQALVPRTGRGFFIALATVLNVGLLIFMRLWQPHPDSIAPLFVITSLFGIADGIWNVNANGLCGSVFPDHFEEAFTGLRVAQGLGGAFSMAYAPVFCMAVKLYVMIAAVVVVFVSYLGADFLIKRDAKKNSTVFTKEIV